MKIWGKNTSLACLDKHPQLIRRVLLGNGFHHERIIKLLKTRRITPKYVEPKILSKIINSHHHQNIVLDIMDPAPLNWEEFLTKVNKQPGYPLILMLDHIVDPHNLGALMRTAYLFGVAGIVMCNRNQVKINSTVINISTGAALDIPVFTTPNLKLAIRKLKMRGYWIYSTSLHGGATPYRQVDFTAPVVIILGNEGKGVSMHVTKAADGNVFIPMRSEFNSLNVSVAGAILMEHIKYSQSAIKKRRQK